MTRNRTLIHKTAGKILRLTLAAGLAGSGSLLAPGALAADDAAQTNA